MFRATSLWNIIDWNINEKKMEFGFDIAIGAMKRFALCRKCNEYRLFFAILKFGWTYNREIRGIDIEP